MYNTFINVFYFRIYNIMNTPNILSNDLDQVAKTGSWYQKELHTKEVKQQIIDAFDKFEHDDFPMEENDFYINTDKSDMDVVEWLLANRTNLPLQDIGQYLRTTKRVSCEIKRQKKEVK